MSLGTIHDQIIDFEDVKMYLTKTDEQIMKGFKKIDQNSEEKLNDE